MFKICMFGIERHNLPKKNSQKKRADSLYIELEVLLTKRCVNSTFDMFGFIIDKTGMDWSGFVIDKTGMDWSD